MLTYKIPNGHHDTFILSWMPPFFWAGCSLDIMTFNLELNTFEYVNCQEWQLGLEDPNEDISFSERPYEEYSCAEIMSQSSCLGWYRLRSPPKRLCISCIGSPAGSLDSPITTLMPKCLPRSGLVVWLWRTCNWCWLSRPYWPSHLLAVILLLWRKRYFLQQSSYFLLSWSHWALFQVDKYKSVLRAWADSWFITLISCILNTNISPDPL